MKNPFPKILLLLFVYSNLQQAFEILFNFIKSNGDRFFYNILIKYI